MMAAIALALAIALMLGAPTPRAWAGAGGADDCNGSGSSGSGTDPCPGLLPPTPPKKGSLSASASPSKTIFVNHQLTVTASLTDPNEEQGDPTSSIDFTLDGAKTNQSVTNLNYYWTPGISDVGNHSLIVSIPKPDDVNYDKNSVSMTIRVVDGDIALDISKDAVPKGDTVTLTAQLNDDGAGGNNISSQNITFSAKVKNDAGEWVDAGSPWPVSATTNSSGIATKPSPPLDAKEYKVTATWDATGDTDSEETMGVEVAIEAIKSTTNNPALDKGVLCLNAQSNYKTAQWKVTVLPKSTTATVTLDSKSAASDVTLAGAKNISDGAVVIVTGGTKTGTYTLNIRSDKLTSLTKSSKPGKAFKFERVTPSFSGGGNPHGPGWSTSSSTDVKNDIVFAYPAGPGGATANGSGSRYFTETIKIGVLPPASYGGNVACDITASSDQLGSVGALGILGFTIKGINVAALHADAKCTSTIKVTTAGATPVSTSTSVSAPFDTLGIADQKVIAGTITASETNVTLSGTAYPKYITVVVTSSFEAHTNSITIPLAGTFTAKANTLPQDDFTLNRGVEKCSNFKIIP